MTTPLFLLRCVQLGISIRDLDLLTIGLVNDMYAENSNDDYKGYKEVAIHKQIILQRGLPFEVKMPSARPVDVSALSEAQMNAELEKGYADMQAGRTRSAKSVFADIRKDYSL